MSEVDDAVRVSGDTSSRADHPARRPWTSRQNVIFVVVLIGAAAFGLLMSGRSRTPTPATSTKTTLPTPLAEVQGADEPAVVMNVSGDVERRITLDRLVSGSLRSAPFPSDGAAIETQPLDLELAVLGPDAAMTLRAFDLEVGVPVGDVFLFVTVDGLTYPGAADACSLVLVDAEVARTPVGDGTVFDEVVDGVGHLYCFALVEERGRTTVSLDVAFRWTFPWTAT